MKSSLLTPIADLVRSKPLLRRWAHGAVRLIPDIPWTVRVPDLGPVRIRLRRHRWFLWEEFAQSDALTFGMFRALIKPGDVVYDIGANIGVYARVMHAWCGAGHVIAFEPMRENFELLRANIALSGAADRFTAFPIALSDADGEEDLQVDDMTSGTAVLSSVSGGAASVGRREFGLPPRAERVTVATLDQIIERERLPPPKVMKIDTEGAEVKVLRGGLATLKTHRPALCIALHSPAKARQTLEILDQLGYSSAGQVHDHAAARDHAMPIVRQIHAPDADLLANNNIVAATTLELVLAAFAP